MDKYVFYVKQELAKGRNVADIVAEFKSHNIDDATINQVFLQSLQQETAQNNPAPNSLSEQPVQNFLAQEVVVSDTNTKEAKKSFWRFDLTKAFMTIGSVLIIAAVVIAVYSQWNNVGPIVRISFLGLPMLLLLYTSYYLSTKKDLAMLYPWTMSLSYLILPLFIGTVLYQSGLMQSLNSRLILYCALASLVVYLITEFFYRQKFVAVFSIAAFLISISSYLAGIWVSSLLSSCCYFAAGIIIFAVGYYLSLKKIEKSSLYLLFGTFLCLALFPSVVTNILNADSNLSYETSGIIYSLIGILYLFIASLFNHISHKLEDDFFYTLKRAIEEVAPVLIIVPYLFLGNVVEAYFGFSLVLGAAAILASVRVQIFSLIVSGCIGVVWSILMISWLVFDDSMSWPLIIFVVGFVSIVLGILVKRVLRARNDSSHQLVYGLGKDFSRASAKNSLTYGRSVLWLLAAFLVYEFGASALYLVYSGYEDSTYTQNEQSVVEDQASSTDNDLSADSESGYTIYMPDENSSQIEATTRIYGVFITNMEDVPYLDSIYGDRTVLGTVRSAYIESENMVSAQGLPPDGSEGISSNRISLLSQDGESYFNFFVTDETEFVFVDEAITGFQLSIAIYDYHNAKIQYTVNENYALVATRVELMR